MSNTINNVAMEWFELTPENKPTEEETIILAVEDTCGDNPVLRTIAGFRAAEDIYISDNEVIPISSITHWMPLPKYPKYKSLNTTSTKTTAKLINPLVKGPGEVCNYSSNLKAYCVHKKCACGGEYVSIEEVIMTDPPYYKHSCNLCGNIAAFKREYPVKRGECEQSCWK